MGWATVLKQTIINYADKFCWIVVTLFQHATFPHYNGIKHLSVWVNLSFFRAIPNTQLVAQPFADWQKWKNVMSNIIIISFVCQFITYKINLTCLHIVKKLQLVTDHLNTFYKGTHISKNNSKILIFNKKQNGVKLCQNYITTSKITTNML